MPLNTPDIKELRAIVDWVNLAEDVREVSLKFGDVELFISRDRQQPAPVAAALAAAPVTVPAPIATPAPVAAAPAAAVPAVAAPAPAAANASAAPGGELAADEIVIKSPMVGTFYAAPKPGADPFVSVGESVKPDTVLCIVEVMKLMNNLEAKAEGTITQILVENEHAVEYGQPLMVIKRHA